ncbi:MAG: MBL fold metallo-hydrolase [Sphingomonadales bacterium]|nr:MAG: MBL fold metallo-hydrolase [Sphingomonadales bacterium]
MPIGGRLEHVNIWAMSDGPDDCTIVDSGMRTPETLAAWERVHSGLLAGQHVSRMIGTHMHPDHVGMFGWLAERHAGTLWMSRLEYYTLRMLERDVGVPPAIAVDFYRAAGMDDAWITGYRDRFGSYAALLHTVPAAFHAIEDNDEIEAGGARWKCIIGNGHSPAHVCLWSPEHKLLISGDQVLPTISSNVSVYPYEPDANPLEDWMASLRKIKAIVPDDVLVLPAHGRPFYGLHKRIDALLEGHDDALDRLHRFLDTPKRAVDVFPALFHRVREDNVTRGMAAGEALAHLVYLARRGFVSSHLDPMGIRWWQADPTARE